MKSSGEPGSLKALLATHHAPGRLDWIGLRAARLAPLQSVRAVRITEAGLDGDHGRTGKRAVTLIQAEHLPVIAALCGLEAVTPAVLRRNLVISGINLSALRGQEILLGEVRLRLTTVCAPCSRMEAALGPGGYNAIRSHGGWCAEVISGGGISLGDSLLPA
ncbi:MOSC domain-containing protein [Alloyangia pacifica]|uniref:MOSC domain n=1 Tax=Alloyangia pacifica TaxID=311180 RepID=A0A1I6P2C9_9RHOB|nr:MOSC domain-containing protein [Alloyangia pacifica]SDH53501.1 MOSC domain [Alloyangia pacifica]SFS34248.1 MOSC domain [Alloyangia pacifica]